MCHNFITVGGVGANWVLFFKPLHEQTVLEGTIKGHSLTMPHTQQEGDWQGGFITKCQMNYDGGGEGYKSTLKLGKYTLWLILTLYNICLG